MSLCCSWYIVAAALLLYFTLKRIFRKSFPEQYIIDGTADVNFEVVGRVPEPDLHQIPTLVKEMRQSFDAGFSRPIETRIEALKGLKRFFVEKEQDILRALHKDLGRPEFEGMIYDVLLPAHDIDSLIKGVRTWTKPEFKGFNLLSFPSTNWVQPEPLGVVLVIGTWNYPINLALTPVAGAIAAGNTVILKTCNVSQECARLMTTLLPKYVDPRILSVVGTAMEGDRQCTSALLDNRFDLVFFTGSPSVGRTIMQKAANFLTPVVLELGGKNPVFVDKSADIDLAAKRTIWGRMMNGGQQCISPDYVLCHRAVADKFFAATKKWIDTFYGGNPKESKDFGRIVGDKQFERVLAMLQNHGGEIVVGGDYDQKTRYIAPTVVKISLDSPTIHEETFGPILWVIPVEDMDEAIKFQKKCEKPLSLYIFVNDSKIEQRIIQNTSSGGVTVNGCLFHAGHPELPFGGVGNSGIGRYHGKASFDACSHPKPILKKQLWPDGGILSDPFFVYAPWDDMKKKIIRFLIKFS